MNDLVRPSSSISIDEFIIYSSWPHVLSKEIKEWYERPESPIFWLKKSFKNGFRFHKSWDKIHRYSICNWGRDFVKVNNKDFFSIGIFTSSDYITSEFIESALEDFERIFIFYTQRWFEIYTQLKKQTNSKVTSSIQETRTSTEQLILYATTNFIS